MDNSKLLEEYTPILFIELYSTRGPEEIQAVVESLEARFPKYAILVWFQYGEERIENIKVLSVLNAEETDLDQLKQEIREYYENDLPNELNADSEQSSK